MGSKFWYESKLVWLGVLQTLIAVGQALAVYLEAGDFSPSSLVLFVTGILTIILRVWYTDTTIN